MKKLVEITNLNYSVRPNSILRLGKEKEILKNISLEIGTNEIIGITGESGSGKTTLIKLIAGILKPTSGEIKFTSQQDWQKIRTNPVQILFQNNNEILNPFRRIESITEEAIHIRNKRKTDAATEKERIFNSVGFSKELRRRRGYELSGGEQQRAALSRILAAKPELLVLDEPFSAQDVVSQVNLLNLFKRINKDFNLTMICVAHNLKILRKLVGRIFVMYNGQIVESGKTEDIFNSPQNDYTKFLIKCENYDLKTPRFKFMETLTD